MQIKKHLLYNDNDTPIPFIASPNVGGLLQPRFLVVHFTAVRSSQSSIEWLCKPEAQASAHFVVSRDGSIAQLVPLNKVAWHAGVSHWAGYDGLNSISFGCELDNSGKLRREGNQWRAWYGGDVPTDQVIEAVHKNESQSAGWQIYTEPQIDSAVTVCNLLVRHYQLKDVVGHDDIAPGRKVDPGPAFPMSSFRAKVMGREGNESGIFRTTTTLNIRSGPGSEFKTLRGSPLAPSTPVRVLKEEAPWFRVDVLRTNKGVSDIVGWVHSRFLQPA